MRIDQWALLISLFSPLAVLVQLAYNSLNRRGFNASRFETLVKNCDSNTLAVAKLAEEMIRQESYNKDGETVKKDFYDFRREVDRSGSLPDRKGDR